MSDPVTAIIPREASPDPVVEKALGEPGSGKTDTESGPPNTPPSTSLSPNGNKEQQLESENGIGNDLPHKDEESSVAQISAAAAPNTDGDATVPLAEHLIAENTSGVLATKVVASGQGLQVPAKEASGETEVIREQNGDARRSIPISDGVAVPASSEQPVTNEANGGAIPAKGTITTEQEVQSPTKETNGDSAAQNNSSVAEQQNGDAADLGNVRVQEDSALPKPGQEGAEETHIKVRRSSTLGYIAEKAKPLIFIPRGRVHKRTTASHGRGGSSGGCVIF